MSERRKEIVIAIALFAGGLLLGLYAAFGRMAFGVMSLSDTRQFCAFWAFGCGICGILPLIGDQRLNDWINPRLDALSKRRKKAKKRRKALRIELDTKDPSRVMRREKRKERLRCAFGWGLLVSPLVAIIVSIVLAVYFKTETYYAILLVAVLYAVQIWGLFLKSYLQIKKEETQ